MVPWSYPTPLSSSLIAEVVLSHAAMLADDLVWMVKGCHQGFLWSELLEKGSFSLSAHQQWPCGLYRVCSVTGEGQGLFHETNSELRSSCRILPTLCRECPVLPAEAFIPLQLHPLPYNCELPLLPAITLHCLICNPAKSLVSKACGSELWSLFTQLLCPVMISCLSSLLLW